MRTLPSGIVARRVDGHARVGEMLGGRLFAKGRDDRVDVGALAHRALDGRGPGHEWILSAARPHPSATSSTGPKCDVSRRLARAAMMSIEANAASRSTSVAGVRADRRRPTGDASPRPRR